MLFSNNRQLLGNHMVEGGFERCWCPSACTSVRLSV